MTYLPPLALRLSRYHAAGGWDAVAREVERSLPDWLPIETAPKDGTRFLFWNGDFVCVAQFVMGKFFAAQGYPDNGMLEPIHWMPLPTAPSEPRA